MQVAQEIEEFRTISVSKCFCVQKLKVLFEVGSEGEVSETLEVSALTCDTVEQVKEKILSTFKAKFGFSYNTSLREICIGKKLVTFLCTVI